MDTEMTSIRYLLPLSLLNAIDQTRGTKTRLQWMREAHAKAAKCQLAQTRPKGRPRKQPPATP